MAVNSPDHRVSCIFHPEGSVSAIETPRFGGIRVEVGPAGYQLNTGEKITL